MRKTSGRAECSPSYSGDGRKPPHPIHVLARSEADITAKAERAARGEDVYRPDDALDDAASGLVVRRNLTGSSKGNFTDTLTGEVADLREEIGGSRTLLPPCWESLSLGARLKSLRLDLGLSCQRFAQDVGVARSTLFMWEKNEIIPKVAHLIRMADLFNVSPGDLLNGLDGCGQSSV